MITEKVFSGVADVVLILNVDCAEAPAARLIEVESNVSVTLAMVGSEEALRDISEEKLLIDAKVTVQLADPPGFMESEEGDTEMEKSPVAQGVISGYVSLLLESIVYVVSPKPSFPG